MEGQDEETKKPTKPTAKAVIVGGSITGLSCANALILAGWDVIIIIEKSRVPPTGSLTSTGLGLEPSAWKPIEAWLRRAQQHGNATLPVAVDQVTLCCPFSEFTRT